MPPRHALTRDPSTQLIKTLNQANIDCLKGELREICVRYELDVIAQTPADFLVEQILMSITTEEHA